MKITEKTYLMLIATGRYVDLHGLKTSRKPLQIDLDLFPVDL